MTRPGDLHRILQWTAAHGEVQALSRLRIKLMPLSIKERIVMDDVDPQTVVSAEYLAAARKAAEEIVGAPFAA